MSLHFRPHQSTRSLRLLSSKMNRNPRNKVIPLWGVFDLRDGMPKSTHLWEYEVGWGRYGRGVEGHGATIGLMLYWWVMPSTKNAFPFQPWLLNPKP